MFYISRLVPLTFKQEYEEVVVPPLPAVPPRSTERQILIAQLDPLIRGSFTVRLPSSAFASMKPSIAQSFPALNRVQSIVYPTAYQSNENMLICGRHDLDVHINKADIPPQHQPEQ